MKHSCQKCLKTKKNKLKRLKKSVIVWCNGDNLFHNVVIYLMLFFEDNFKLNFYSFGEIQYLLYVKKSFMVAYLFPEHKLLLELVVRLDFLC